MTHEPSIRSRISTARRRLMDDDYASACASVAEALASNEAEAITTIKREKIFFVPRSASSFEAMSDGVLSALTSDEHEQTLRRLLIEHESVLKPLWVLEKRLSALPLWGLPRRTVAKAVASVLEAYLAASETSTTVASSDEIEKDFMSPVNQASNITSQTRSMMDAGVLAMREVLRRCENSHTKYREKVDIAWIDDLLQISIERDQLQGTMDRYAYFDWEISTEGGDLSTIEVRPSDTEEYESFLLAAQRGVMLDYQHAIEAGVLKAYFDFHSAPKEVFQHLVPEGSFREGELLKNLDASWENLARKVARGTGPSVEMAQAFAASIDEKPEIKSAFKLRLYCWEFLKRVALVYQAAAKKLDLKGPFALSFNWQRLVDSASKAALITRSQAEEALHGISIDISDPDSNADLFMTPLVRLSSSVVLLLPHYALNSRHVRNILKSLSKSHGFNPREAGPFLVTKVRQDFDEAGFIVSPEKPLEVPGDSGKPVTDIDLAALKDSHLFIVEVRSHSYPDSRHEEYRAKERIIDAAENALQGVEFARDHPEAIAEWLGVSEEELCADKITPLVVTNILDFSGLRYDSVMVIDDSALGKSLVDPLISVSILDEEMQKQETKFERRLFEGSTPTASELISLLENPFWRDLSRVEHFSQTLDVGGTVLTAHVGKIVMTPPPDAPSD